MSANILNEKQKKYYLMFIFENGEIIIFLEQRRTDRNVLCFQGESYTWGRFTDPGPVTVRSS